MTDNVKVTDADREVFWSVWLLLQGDCRPWAEALKKQCLGGQWDKDHGMKIVARHRQDAVKELVEGLEKAVGWFLDYVESHDEKARQAVDSDEYAARREKANKNAERASELAALIAKHGGNHD